MATLTASPRALRIAAIVALLAIIAAMIYLGCGCRAGWTRETFADADEAEAAEAAVAEADAKPDKVPKADAEDEAKAVKELAEIKKAVAAGKPLKPTPKKEGETIAETTKREIEELVLAAPKAFTADPVVKRAIGAMTAEKGEFSKREMDLFEDLKSNKLSDKEIVNLVKTGVLNEALVEKFLSKLDSTAAQLALEDEQLRGEMKRPASLANDEAAASASVEGFCSMAPGYAKW